MLCHVVDRVARQQAFLPRCRDSAGEGSGPIRADAVRRQKRAVLQHLAEEPLGSVEVALRGQQEVDRLAMLVDGTVQVALLASDADVGFVDADESAVRLAERLQPPFD